MKEPSSETKPKDGPDINTDVDEAITSNHNRPHNEEISANMLEAIEEILREGAEVWKELAKV